jgi:hypothetical protein
VRHFLGERSDLTGLVVEALEARIDRLESLVEHDRDLVAFFRLDFLRKIEAIPGGFAPCQISPCAHASIAAIATARGKPRL